MAFRSQEFHELCSVCKEAAVSACPRCGVALCEQHAHAPYGCCERCATDIYLSVSKAGHRALTVGAIACASCLAAFYFFAPVLTPILVGVLLAGAGGGLMTVFWGGLVAPRIAEHRRRTELTRPRELAPPHVEEDADEEG